MSWNIKKKLGKMQIFFLIKRIQKMQRIQRIQRIQRNIKKLFTPYPQKKINNCGIPLNIFQTWHTKQLPQSMIDSVENIKMNNPNFNYQLFDDEDCRNFIQTHFDNSVLNAFDCLKPGAYKADLWRYCVLYISGGIYIDIKYQLINNFKFDNLLDNEYFVLDLDKKNIYNALMIVKPNNEKLKFCINTIVKNVKYKYYGKSSLDVTGPGLLSKFFTIEEKKKLEMNHELFFGSFDNKIIKLNGYVILKIHCGYRNDQENNAITGHCISFASDFNDREISDISVALFSVLPPPFPAINCK